MRKFSGSSFHVSQDGCQVSFLNCGVIYPSEIEVQTCSVLDENPFPLYAFYFLNPEKYEDAIRALEQNNIIFHSLNGEIAEALHLPTDKNHAIFLHDGFNLFLFHKGYPVFEDKKSN